MLTALRPAQMLLEVKNPPDGRPLDLTCASPGLVAVLADFNGSLKRNIAQFILGPLENNVVWRRPSAVMGN